MFPPLTISRCCMRVCFLCVLGVVLFNGFVVVFLMLHVFLFCDSCFVIVKFVAFQMSSFHLLCITFRFKCCFISEPL